jgi:predicted RNA-binding Zn-ribbon protein involved in translation (DUF1610 family)
MPLTTTCPGCRSTLRIRDEFAGQQMKCPRCGAAVHVPTAEEEPAPREAPEAVTAARGTGKRPSATKTCPACGERIALTARKCRFCRAWLDEDDEDDDDRRRPRSYFKPCPRCGARGAQRVIFTFWGSFYGPALFHHVRCPDCGYAYNGKTGRSNLIPAIVFVTVPALGILAVLGCLTAVLVSAFRG